MDLRADPPYPSQAKADYAGGRLLKLQVRNADPEFRKPGRFMTRV
jgi:hypothetical protein